MYSYIRHLAQLPSGVIRFVATETTLGIGIGMLNMILNLHLLAIGLDPQDIGEITSAGTLTMGLVSFPSGYLVSKFGRKRMLVFGLALMALAYAGFGLGHGKWGMLVAQLGWSAGLTFLVTSEIQLLFQYCPDKRQETQAYALLFAVFTLFTGIGTLLGGYLPKWLGGASSVYQYTFYAGAVFIALGAFLRGVLLPGASDMRPQPEEEKVVLTQSLAIAAGRTGSFSRLLKLSVSIFLIGFTFNMANPYLNVIVQYRFGWADEQVSLLLSGVGVALFFGSLLMPLVIDRFGMRKAFAYAFAVNALLVFALAAPIGAAAFSAVLLLRGGCFTLLTNMIDSETMSAIDESERNRFAGMRTVFRSVGSALAAYAGGAVLEAKNTGLPFALTGISLLLGWAWFLAAALPSMRRKERAPQPGTGADMSA
ncbi:MFS transporter [Gordoniibacillus kamchatkensis]|uniref:MFS transporter n=1 Tax=Gordoniibacillus kamchatkensis TaxID=1590651 RepID=UPI000698969D|nr:MFS transporter [Paenibacillus sp. VKM B-2647]